MNKLQRAILVGTIENPTFDVRESTGFMYLWAGYIKRSVVYPFGGLSLTSVRSSKLPGMEICDSFGSVLFSTVRERDVPDDVEVRAYPFADRATGVATLKDDVKALVTGFTKGKQ